MRVQDLVPEVYYKESRDFSFIGRLFEILFNYMKTASDLVGSNPDNEYINSNLVDLVSINLGFKPAHKYITKDLISVANSFSELLKYKGTKYSIEKAISILLNSQNIKTEAKVLIETEDQTIINPDKNKLIIRIPHAMKDVVLLEDLFNYILPTGYIYEIQYIPETKATSTTEILIDTTVAKPKFNDDKLGQVTNDDNKDIVTDSANERSAYYTGVVVSSTPQTETEGE